MLKQLYAASGLCLVFLAAAPARAMSPDEVHQQILPSVASVFVTRQPMREGTSLSVLWQGSGFVLDQTLRYVQTVCDVHLKSPSANVVVAFVSADGPSWWRASARCIGDGDLALVQITERAAGPHGSIPPALRIRQFDPVNSVDPRYDRDAFIAGFIYVVPTLVRARFATSADGFSDPLRLQSVPDSLGVSNLLGDPSGLNGAAIINKEGEVIATVAKAAKGLYYAHPLQPSDIDLLASLGVASADATPPFVLKGTPYSTVRKTLIERGFVPMRLSYCQGPPSKCQKYPELQGCNGAAPARCTFVWEKGTTSVDVGSTLDEEVQWVSSHGAHPE